MEQSNIYKKIQAIATEIKGIDKDMSVGKGSKSEYKAVSDKSVIIKVKEAELKHGIISIPIKQELVNSQILTSLPDQYGNVRNTYVDIIKMTIKVIDVNNPADSIEVESFGRGVDSSDKGFGKASTYARKYALLNLYKIATGVDPDENPSKPTEQMAPADIIKLQVENHILANNDYRNNVLAHFCCSDVSELSPEIIKTIYNDLKKKGIL